MLRPFVQDLKSDSTFASALGDLTCYLPTSTCARLPTSSPCSLSFCFLPRRVYLHCHFLLKVFWLWPPSCDMPGVVPLSYAASCLCLFLLALPPPHTCLLSPPQETLFWRSLHPLDRVKGPLFCVSVGLSHLSWRVSCAVISHFLPLLANMLNPVLLACGRIAGLYKVQNRC